MVIKPGDDLDLLGLSVPVREVGLPHFIRCCGFESFPC